jgi:microcystin-dependent protein
MDYFIGSIELFPYIFAHYGWMYCDGQLLSIWEYDALFALIGNRFGGDGVNNFALPNLQGAEPIPGLHYLICVDGIYPNRD